MNLYIPIFLLFFIIFFMVLKFSFLNFNFVFIFFPSYSQDFNMKFNFNFYSFSFFSVVFLVGLLVSFYIFYYMKSSINFFYFFILKMSFLLSMFLLIFSGNWLTLYLGWDGLGITSYFLIIFYQNLKSFNAGTITMFSNRMGDFFFLIFLINLSFSNFNFFSGFFFSQNFLFLMILVVLFSTKSAQFPFSAWLPAAMAAPTPISALVHSSTLVTAGIFVLFQTWPLWNNFYSLKIINLMALLTLLFSGFSALFEKDFKKVIAFSTLNQLSFIVLTLSNGFVYLGLFHLFTHAFFKSNLFLSMGVIIHQNLSIQDSRLTFSKNSLNFFFIFCLILSCLNLMGFIFLSGFFSKDLIIELQNFSNFSFFFYVKFICLFFTFFYSWRLLKLFNNEKTFLSVFHTALYLSFSLPISFLSLMGIFMGSFLIQNFFSLNLIFFSFFSMKFFILLFIFIPILLNFFNFLNVFFSKKMFFSIFFLNTISLMFSGLNSLILKSKKNFEQGFIFSFFMDSNFFLFMKNFFLIKKKEIFYFEILSILMFFMFFLMI